MPASYTPGSSGINNNKWKNKRIPHDLDGRYLHRNRAVCLTFFTKRGHISSVQIDSTGQGIPSSSFTTCVASAALRCGALAWGPGA